MLRSIQVGDLPETERIARDPEIIRQGLNKQGTEFVKNVHAICDGRSVKNRLGEVEVYVYDNDGAISGFIQLTEFNYKKFKCGYAGWDFLPHVWGKGITSTAFRSFLDQVIKPRRIQYLLACCYVDNHRCIKFMLKHGFERQTVSWLKQLIFVISNRQLRRMASFQMAVSCSAQQGDAPEPATNVDSASQSSQPPAR